MISPEISSLFESHAATLRTTARERREQLALRSVAVVGDDAEVKVNEAVALLGKPLASDRWEGDCHRRTLHALLSMVDDRGFERYASHANSFFAYAFAISPSAVSFVQVAAPTDVPRSVREVCGSNYVQEGLGGGQAGHHGCKRMGKVLERGDDQYSKVRLRTCTCFSRSLVAVKSSD
jgi:hypothetical protein